MREDRATIAAPGRRRSVSPKAAQAYPSPRPPGLAVFALALLGAVALRPAEALAHCAPPTGSNETVACAGKTVNQTPGTNSGYGDSTQNGLTVTVGAGASVIGMSMAST